LIRRGCSTEYRDTYRDTLRAMIEQKIEGREIEAPKLPGPPKVTDLMEALRETLARKGEVKKAPSREAAAEPAAAKRRRRGGRRRPAA
jgi:non-homologous end joining protein Ku